jgi:tRNA-splicing ligase RtcB
MPDIHWGYGFPIGGVAAFDPREGGVVSPGGVGFDVNCGVRLLTSEIQRGELERRKDRLADALYEAVPSGMGRGRTDFRMSREELAEVLVEGPAPLVERGFGEMEDVGHIESGGKLTSGGSRSSGPWDRATTSSRSSTWTRFTTRKPRKRSACARSGSRS